MFDWELDWLLETCFPTVGLILAFGGAVRLGVRKKTGAWKEGGAAALAGGTIAGAAAALLCLMLSSRGDPDASYYGLWAWALFMAGLAGLVFGFDRGVQWCVRNRAGKWKEGGASLLAGIMVAGVPIVWAVLYAGQTEYLSIPGLVLAFNGAVQLCVRKKKGPWEEGGASLLAGAIIVGGSILLSMGLDMRGVQLLGSGGILVSCWIAGLVLFFNGVADLP